MKKGTGSVNGSRRFRTLGVTGNPESDMPDAEGTPFRDEASPRNIKPNRFFNWILSGLYLFAIEGRIGDIAFRSNAFFIVRYKVEEGVIPPWTPKWANDRSVAFQKGPKEMDAWDKEHPILFKLRYGYGSRRK